MCVRKGTEIKASRMSGGVTSLVTLMIAYSNIFLNSLIYILLYDVIRSSLIKWVRASVAKFWKQPSSTI